MQVQLPAAARGYRVAVPSDSDQLIRAVRSSLEFLSIAPDRVSIPLLAAVYRAPLCGVDFSLFLAGRTGTFKTALAALCQQHFGADMDAGHLPANFASTPNALEELSFSTKDTLLVVDDFCPTSGAGDQALYQVAERLFRAAGNNQGRTRMGGPRRLRVPRPPPGLVLATGEEVPKGHSLRALLLIVDLKLGDVDKTALSRCQAAGRDAKLSAAMGAYLSWIATRYEELLERLHTRVSELRRLMHNESMPVHARLPTTIAELQSGWEIWLNFAREVDVISRAEQWELEARCRSALVELAAPQVFYQQASDPALYFLTLLKAALACGRVHIADRRGKAPDAPERWGWRKQNGRAWIPQGTCIGWVAAGDLFLQPEASYQAAQQIAGAGRIPISSQTLRCRLREHGLLASIDAGRQMLLVRRILEGTSRQVLHLRANVL